MLRLGGEYIGYRNGPVPSYSEYSDITVTLSPRIVPYAHISATIGRVDLFAVIENPAGWNFQQVYGFNAPRALIRYGIVWTFDD